MAHDGRVWTPRVFSPPASIGPDRSSDFRPHQQRQQQQQTGPELMRGIRQHHDSSADPKPCTSEEAVANSTADATRRPKIGKKPKVFETAGEDDPTSSRATAIPTKYRDDDDDRLRCMYCRRVCIPGGGGLCIMRLHGSHAMVSSAFNLPSRITCVNFRP